MDSPARVSISFRAQPRQPLPAQETVNQPDPAPVIAKPLTIDQTNRPYQPRRKPTQPPDRTAQLLESSEESDEYVEVSTALRPSTRKQEQLTSRSSERVLEEAGQQLQKTRSSQRANQRQSVEARNFVDLLNNRRHQLQFVHRPGAIQEETSKKRSRTDMNEAQLTHSTSKMTTVEDHFFGTTSSTGHSVSSDFFLGAGIAKRFDRLRTNENLSFQGTNTRISTRIL